MDKIEPIHLIILVGAAQGLLIGLVTLLKKSSAPMCKWLLGSGLLILSIRLAIYPFAAISEEVLWNTINNITLLSLLLVGPLIYLFLVARLSGLKQFRFWQLLHILPFLYYLGHFLNLPLPIPICYCYAPLISGTLYGFISLLVVYRHKFTPDKKYLALIAGSLFLLPVMVVTFDLFDLSNKSLDIYPATVPYIILSVGLFNLGFNSLRTTNRCLDGITSAQVKKSPPVDSDRLESLITVIESEQLYLDPDLTLHKLSKQSGFSRHEISELINLGLHKNFNKVINEYRVKEVKNKLTDPSYDHLSIMGIATESGFKSKSTFNSCFKKNTGITPREFKNRDE